MSAISGSLATSQPIPNKIRETAARIGPLGAIVLLHILFFYALQSGLLRQAAQVMPKEIIATFITPTAPKPEPLKPQPSRPAPTPKTVPIVKKPAAAPKPVTPAATPQPAETAIAVPPPAQQNSDPPVAPALPAPPAAAPAPAPAQPAQPKTVSGVEYVQAPEPEYPPGARRRGEEGRVTLRVLINEKGRPERVEIQRSSGSATLDEAARQAALRALFKPYIEDGKALPVFALIPIKFQLDN